jgi:hypothetical protein
VDYDSGGSGESYVSAYSDNQSHAGVRGEDDVEREHLMIFKRILDEFEKDEDDKGVKNEIIRYKNGLVGLPGKIKKIFDDHIEDKIQLKNAITNWIRETYTA